MAANFSPYRFLDPASQNTTGRGGLGTSLGRGTWLGAAPVPQSVAPAGGTRLSTARRRSGLPLGSTITYNGGSGSMGRQRGLESSLDRRPTFQSASAYYNARGSDLDRLESVGPSRSGAAGTGLGPVSYGGRTMGPTSVTNATGTRARAGNQVIDFTTGQNLDAANPYTALTGDSVTSASSPMDTSPQGRYNRMAAEQDALTAAGLEEGRAAAAEVRALQNTMPPTQVQSEPFGTGRLATSPYGLGASTVGQGLPKSFGASRSPTPEADRQAEIGERAIASRARRGISVPSLLESYRRRIAR